MDMDGCGGISMHVWCRSPGNYGKRMRRSGNGRKHRRNFPLTMAELPTYRAYHVATALNGKLLVWGGCDEYRNEFKALALSVEIYDPRSGEWEKKSTSGTPPPGSIGGAYTTIGSFLYFFGGYDGTNYYKNLHQLNLQSLQWKEMVPVEEGPSRKSACGLVAYLDDLLVVFGGFSASIQHTDELHAFDLSDNSWSIPHTSGMKPTPRCAFTFKNIDFKRAVLFGGQEPRSKLSNDVFIVNMEEWHWNKIVTEGPKPTPRSHQGACCIDDQHSPLLLVIGGMGGAELDDVWILNMNTQTWKKVELSVNLPYHGHSVTFLDEVSKKYHEIVAFGRASKVHFTKIQMTATELYVVTPGVLTLYDICLECVVDYLVEFAPLLHLLSPTVLYDLKERERMRKSAIIKVE